MESLVFAILFPASGIRQRVRYSIGDTPTVSLNLSAKVDRARLCPRTGGAGLLRLNPAGMKAKATAAC
jgi:hypothetical protein